MRRMRCKGSLQGAELRTRPSLRGNCNLDDEGRDSGANKPAGATVPQCEDYYHHRFWPLLAVLHLPLLRAFLAMSSPLFPAAQTRGQARANTARQPGPASRVAAIQASCTGRSEGGKAKGDPCEQGTAQTGEATVARVGDSVSFEQPGGDMGRQACARINARSLLQATTDRIDRY